MRPIIWKGCTDPRVPNGRIARALPAALMPSPGARFPISTDYVNFYREKHGLTPCINAPHKGGCLAWVNEGGDDAGFDYAAEFSAFFYRHGIPSAALGLLDGLPPVLLYDGLSGLGRTDILMRIQQLIDDPQFDWRFNHNVVAQSVNIGHFFEKLPYPNVLRFASYGVTPETIGTVTTVINHYASGQVPAYISPEVGPGRQGEIARMLAESHAPVLLRAQ